MISRYPDYCLHLKQQKYHSTVLSGPALATRGVSVFVVFPLANWLAAV